MKKYLEQRVEELELEVKLLRAKIKLNDTKDTSKYLNNYPKYDPLKSYSPSDGFMYNSSSNLDTAFASPFDPLTPAVNLETITHLDSDFPPYPDILDSWDNNPDDIIEEESSTIPNWGFVSEFDKMDKDFLEWLKSNEAKNAYEISKNITDKYGKTNYRPLKAK